MSEEKRNWLDKTPIPALPWLTTEVLIFAFILVAAIVSRYVNLDLRAMSHDESLHTYYSYLLYKGQGYQHNPMMHGPLQFHLIALTYFILGASDFTARIPAATFGILSIAAIWIWRRYLGRAGALAAAAMALISPFLLYYERYTREDSYVALSLFVLLFAILRYLETRNPRYIYFIAGSLVIHYLTKETSFIYTAQILIYLAVYLLAQVTRKPWTDNIESYRGFLLTLAVSVVLLGATGYTVISNKNAAAAAQALTPANPAGTSPLAAPATGQVGLIVLAALTGVALVGAVFFLLRGYGLTKLRRERSFDLLIVFGTIVLPMLTAFPVKLVGWDPLDYTMPGMIHTLTFFIPIVLLTIVIGYWWNWSVWWKMALFFWGPYTLLYTTVFTNGAGFFTGTVGSLGYWLAQQGVQRGSQPWYYYILITIPVYEYLPALACVLALFLSLRKYSAAPIQEEPAVEEIPAQTEAVELEELEHEDAHGDAEIIVYEPIPESEARTNLLTLLGWWTISSILAFSLAGEKMPWLTFHIDLPMVLWGGWAIGQIIDAIDWHEFRQRKPLLLLTLIAVFLLSMFGVLLSVIGNPRPFSGQELTQLEATTSLLFASGGVLASLIGLFVLMRGWKEMQIIYLNILVFFGLLAVLTVRTAFRANYIKYDSAQEYLVYAHSFSGVKDMLRQIDDISGKTVGGKDIVVAYDDATSWPLSWYMREYPNSRFYGDQPDNTLKDATAIIVGEKNFAKVEPIVKDNYYEFDYIRMVWPNQDYFNLVSPRSDPKAPFDVNYSCSGVLSVFRLLPAYDFSRVCSAIGNPRMRTAIFNIWLNRDYSLYGDVTQSKAINDTTWEPSDKMRLYVRKDVVDKIWSYGIKTVAQPKVDPYAKGVITLPASLVIGTQGSDPGQFNAPRGMAFAPDGSLYVADSRNNRIQHLGPDGKVINSWGTFADQSTGKAPAGTFNEPWGVAVGLDGSVYVTDTWNHRVQKFTADGKPVSMWGVFGTSETPGALYGPRGITVDSKGRIYVADTGNKRIVVFDSNGAVLTQFGSDGLEPGQFSEPVDVKVDSQGIVYVTDTWNQRIQLLSSTDGINYAPLKQWPVSGWLSQTLENKPFIALQPDGKVYITDPEGYRVIEFNPDGQFVQLWGQFGTDNASFGLASGIAIAPDGSIWVSDSANNRLMKFSVPAK